MTLTFDLDLKINRDHLLGQDYLPTKFEASGAKRSWVISCTRWSKLAWPLTLDLLTWKSIGIIYSPRTIYLPSLKLLGGKVFLSYQLHKVKWIGMTFDFDLWPTDLKTIYSPRTICLPSLKLLGQSVIQLSVAQSEGLPTYRPTDRCKAICPPFSKGA